MNIFDPDRRWFSKDKWQHGGLSAAGGFFLGLFFPFLQSVLWVMVFGIGWEVGATEAAYQNGKLGQAGYGISLLDLAWNFAGAIAGALFAGVVK